MNEKKCIKCGEVKAIDLFSSGRTECRMCKSASNKAWYEANPDKIKAKNKAYREANPDKIKAKNKAYREANPAYNKAYREANPDKIKAKEKAYIEANPDKIKAKNKAYSEALSDSYIAGALGLKTSQAPSDLIALKREQLQIIRLIRDIKNERKPTDETS